MADQSPSLRVRVSARRPLTGQIDEFVLEPVGGETLPPFEAGAHVTVETPSGAMRRYSLVSNGSATGSYTISVKRELQSRGGSASMHDQAIVGTELMISPPENTFGLKEAPEYMLIAGGIGITPIYAMAQELKRKNKRFHIIYCTRNPTDTAYLDEMTEAFGDNLTIHHDDGDPDKIYDFWEHLKEPKKTHVYCCGPKPLMEEIEGMTGHWGETNVHFEDFKPIEVVREGDVAFEIELKRSRRRLTVPADRSILETLRDNGLPTVSSCESGTCGTCKTRLLGGDVDHRDMVLMEDEKSDYIMTCVSRATSGSLVLDL